MGKTESTCNRGSVLSLGIARAGLNLSPGTVTPVLTPRALPIRKFGYTAVYTRRAHPPKPPTTRPSPLLPSQLAPHPASIRHRVPIQRAIRQRRGDESDDKDADDDGSGAPPVTFTEGDKAIGRWPAVLLKEIGVVENTVGELRLREGPGVIVETTDGWCSSTLAWVHRWPPVYWRKRSRAAAGNLAAAAQVCWRGS